MDELFALGLEIQTLGGAAAKKTLQEIDEAGKGVAGRFNALAKPVSVFKGLLATIGIGFTVKAVADLFTRAIHEASDAQSAMERYKQSLENAGASQDDFAERAEKATKSLQRLTRFEDDDAIAALATMTTITKDASGSINNLGLVADIAAAKQIDLQSAATLVGRVMAGNTSMLARYGIVVTDSSHAMDELRKTFSGFAERDGATFSGRLEMIRNQFGNVLEAIGNVIIGGDELGDNALHLSERLEALSVEIDKNAEKWRGWAKSGLDENGGPLHFLNVMSERLERIGLKINQIIFDKIPEAARAVAGLEAGGGGGGGGRDTPTGPLVLPGAVVMARKPGRTGPPPKTGKDGKEVKIPSPDLGFGSVDDRRIEDLSSRSIKIGGIEANPDAKNSTPLPGIGMSVDDLDDLFKNYWKSVAEKRDAVLAEEQASAMKSAAAMQTIADTISNGMAQTLGDAINNAFSAAFNGEGIGGFIKAFGKTILAGVGGIFTQLGMVYLEYGGIMQALSALLPNPFTAGPAGLAIGAALIAMGAALGAVGKGKGNTHSASLNSSRYGSGTEQMTRLKFVDRPDVNTQGMARLQPLHVTIIGENDPRAQRMLQNMITKGQRRAA